jgi:hypothetical protein
VPRYFFHLEAGLGGERIADKRGCVLPDDSAARREAAGITAALERRRGNVWRVIVANEWGHDVTEILRPIAKHALPQQRECEDYCATAK